MCVRPQRAGLIRKGTLRGNRGLGPGCHGTLESVTGGAGPVVYYSAPDGPSGGRRAAGGSASSRGGGGEEGERCALLVSNA